jgi:hypothetical protein
MPTKSKNAVISSEIESFGSEFESDSSSDLENVPPSALRKPVVKPHLANAASILSAEKKKKSSGSTSALAGAKNPSRSILSSTQAAVPRNGDAETVSTMSDFLILLLTMFDLTRRYELLNLRLKLSKRSCARSSRRLHPLRTSNELRLAASVA